MQRSGLAPTKQVAYFEYNFSKHGGAIGDIEVSGDGIPAGAVIDQGKVHVLTSLAGATATVALKAVGTADLLAATAITGMTAGDILDTVPDGTAANAVLTAAAIDSITATVATAALTAGKFVVAVEYYQTA